MVFSTSSPSFFFTLCLSLGLPKEIRYVNETTINQVVEQKDQSIDDEYKEILGTKEIVLGEDGEDDLEMWRNMNY